MAFNLKELLLKTLLPTLESIGESKLVDVLQKFHDANTEQYEVSLRAGHTFIKPLIELVAKTSTPFDDVLVDTLNDAITTSASLNGIIFSDQI